MWDDPSTSSVTRDVAMIHRKLRSRLTAPRGSEALVGTLFDERYRVHAWIGGGAYSNVDPATEGGGGGPAPAPPRPCDAAL